jgi:hypothetical protein
MILHEEDANTAVNLPWPNCERKTTNFERRNTIPLHSTIIVGKTVVNPWRLMQYVSQIEGRCSVGVV